MRTRICGVVLAAALVATGCSVLPGEDEEGLAAALAATPAGAGGEQAFFYSDLSAASAAGRQTASGGQQPYGTASAYGLGNLARIRATHPELLPAEAAEDATAVTIGQPPEVSFRFTGMDLQAAESTLATGGGQRSELAGGTLLVRRADNEVDLEDELSAQVLSAMNTVWYDDDVLVGASTQQNARRWVQDGESLADADGYTGVADCLGEDLVGAALSADTQTLPDGVTAFGTATAGTSPDDWADLLCLRSEDPQALAAGVRAAVTDGQSAVSQRPWSDLLGEATVEPVDDGWVRVRTTQTPGVFFQAYQSQDLPSLVGG